MAPFDVGIYPQFASFNAATAAAILQMAAKSGAAFELKRLHGMGEGVYDEVLKNPLVACRVYAPDGAHKDLLAYLVRRLLENGANSSFVHQLADAAVPVQELLVSPLLAAYASLQVPPVAEFDAKLAASALSISSVCYKTWSKTTVTERASILRLTARGPWVGISPRNFPLASFLGQVAAALATPCWPNQPSKHREWHWKQ